MHNVRHRRRTAVLPFFSDESACDGGRTGDGVLRWGGYFIFCCFGFVALGGDGKEDDLLAIGMAPLLPYIVSAPAFLFASGTDEWGKGQPMVAYLLGTAGYAVADLLLAINLFSSFDRRAGRTVDSPSGQTLQP